MYTHEVVRANRQYDNSRRYPRFLISVPTSLARPEKAGTPVVRGLSLDLSRGGAAAVLCGAPAVGETVRLSLHLEGASLETLAIVRHSNSTRSGFEFVDLSPAFREQLENRIRALEERPWPWRPGSSRPAFMP
jgi:c-di-GMP-binding flagellar brake protein YcgR